MSDKQKGTGGRRGQRFLTLGKGHIIATSAEERGGGVLEELMPSQKTVLCLPKTPHSHFFAFQRIFAVDVNVRRFGLSK